jgi:hypothetical protein
MRSTSRLPDVISTSGRYEPPVGSALAALLALVSADDDSAKAERIEAMVAADGCSPRSTRWMVATPRPAFAARSS